MASRAASPSIQSKLVQLRDLRIWQGFNIRRWNQLLLIGDSSHFTLDVAPDKLSVLGKIVALIVPGGLSTTGGGSVCQSTIYVTEVLDVDLMPNVLAFTHQETLLSLQHSSGKPVRLNTLLVTRSAARSVDSGRADDRRLDTFGVLLASLDDDLVNIAVERVVREVKELIDAIPVVVLLRTVKAPSVAAEILNGENASAGGVDHPHRLFRSVVGGALGDCLCRRDMVTVGTI